MNSGAMKGSHEGAKTRSAEEVGKRLKFIAPLRNERTDATSEHADYLGLENIQSWTGNLLPSANSDTSEGGDSAGGTANVFYSGDVLFGKLRPYLAKALHAEKDGVCSTELLVLKPQPDIHPRFLLYSMLSPDFVGQVDASTFGAKMPRANWEFIGSMKLPTPTYETQNLIADYLDRETARIDALVAEKEKMLALLEEKRAALISRSVTRGLDPSAPLKPSGLDWLGDIPVHWEDERAKNLFSVRDQRSKSGLEELLTVSHITGVTPRSEKDVYMFQADDKAGYKCCYPGDLVINTLWGWMGAMGISPLEGIVSPDYHVYTSKGFLLPEFVELLCRSRPFVAEVNRWSKGVWSSRLRLYPENFFEMRLPVPPHEDQRDIIAAVEESQNKTKELAGVMLHSITLAKERRAALITAAVTGQIPVEEMSL
ncbi:MAG: restriction endonuclease subunit S [Pseudomonadota bacterium]